jgi:DNA-binding NarL/FixJ family response regulator
MNETAVGPDRDSIRILVVDDNALVLSALVDLLEDEQDVCVVGAALRVEDAIELALSCRPDVVLVDVNMPGGGGRRVVSAIRCLRPGIRIIALSSYLDQDSISSMLATGADMCLSKSEDFSTLMRSLTR